MAFQNAKIHEQDTQVIGKAGKIMHFHCTANVALRDEKGAPIGVIVISSDITERKRAEGNLKQLALTLQEHVEKLEESKKKIMIIGERNEEIQKLVQDALTGKYLAEKVVNILESSIIPPRT